MGTKGGPGEGGGVDPHPARVLPARDSKQEFEAETIEHSIELLYSFSGLSGVGELPYTFHSAPVGHSSDPLFGDWQRGSPT